MPNILNKKMTVLPSNCDCRRRLSLQNVLCIFEDVASEHARQLGIDAQHLIADCNAYWVVSRSRIIFNGHPAQFDEVEIATWPLQPDSFKFHRCYSISANSKPLIVGKTEWLMLDCTTHHIRRVEQSSYPVFDHVETDTCGEPFEKSRDTFDESNFVGETIIRSADIDSNLHTNNVVYCRILMNLFSIDFYNGHQIKQFDIEYIAESHEGDVLRCYMKPDGDAFLFEIRRDDKTIVKAKMIFEPAK